MKKVLFAFVLLAAAVPVFLFGWAQFGVPAGSFGVLRSKTHGVDPRIIQEGEFRWVWYKLIPANADVQTFRLNRRSVPVSAKGMLPSADIYAAFAGIRADFSWELEGNVFYSRQPESLPDLVKNHAVNGQEDLESWEQRVSEEIENFALERFRAYAEKGNLSGEGRIISVPDLETELAAAFPGMENWEIPVKTIRFPDLTLYNDIKGLHEDYLAAQKKILDEDIVLSAAKTIASRKRFEELTLYGELLTKYPVLLNYLAIEKGLPLPGAPASEER